MTRQFVAAALLPIDHADGRFARQTGLAERLDGVQRGPAGGDHVLEQADPLALLEDAFEPVGGAVLLRRLADEQERQPGGERRGRRERNGAELGAGEAGRVRLLLRDGVGERLAQRAEQVGAGLEAVLVEVVARAAARAQDEVAFEVGVLGERGGELVAGSSCGRSTASASSTSGCRAATSAAGRRIEPSSNQTSTASSRCCGAGRAQRCLRRPRAAGRPYASRIDPVGRAAREVVERQRRRCVPGRRGRDRARRPPATAKTHRPARLDVGARHGARRLGEARRPPPAARRRRVRTAPDRRRSDACTSPVGVEQHERAELRPERLSAAAASTPGTYREGSRGPRGN